MRIPGEPLPLTFLDEGRLNLMNREQTCATTRFNSWSSGVAALSFSLTNDWGKT